MQDSRIKILRDRPPFRIAPTESAFLQPSPPDRPSERGRFRIGDSDTEAGELAQSFAQIYEKISHFSKFYTDYFSSAIGDPNSNPPRRPESVGERSRSGSAKIGRTPKTDRGGCIPRIPPPVSYAKRFRQAEHESRIRPDYAETR